MATVERFSNMKIPNSAVTVLTACLFAAPLSGCGVAYVLSSGYHQAELLASRRPIERVLAEGRLSAGEEQRLRMIPEIKAYGRSIGLGATRNYETLAQGWDHTIWNLSACEPLSFQAQTWTFPIVGKVPYLGYFDEAPARKKEAELAALGLEVHLRTAGAYSTLGWFRDPVLPGMLRWSEAQLAETVLHELAHGTLWVPGSVSFNESFANFVGETAVLRYLTDRYGPEGRPVQDLLREDRDWARFEAVLHALYEDLDTVYRDTEITVDEKASRKAALYGELEARALAAGLEDPQRYVNHVRRGTWNNARLMQFKAYNSNADWFETILERNRGDVGAFIDDIRKITHRQRDPFAALEAAAKGAVQNP